MSGNPELRAAAAHWLNLRLSGDMTPDDERRFGEWLDQSGDHRDAYRRVDRAWTVSGAVAGDPALSAPPEPEAAETGSRAWYRHGVAIAASLLLLAGVGWTAFPQLRPGAGPDRQDQAFRTGTGQRTRVTLTDGSIVTLDAETEMQLHDSASERRLDLLRGRAFFRVAHDPHRPFMVYAGGKRVRAIGTAFEVSFEGGRMIVTLAEGKVRVEGATSGTDSGTDMVPGRQLAVSPDSGWTLRQVDVAKETSWTSGRLIFMHDPLTKAVTEVNRYSTRKVVFREGRIPDKQIVGVFEAGDVEGFVKAIELNGIAHRVSASSDEIVLAADE